MAHSKNSIIFSLASKKALSGCVSLRNIAAKALNLFQIIVQYVNIVSAKVDFD